MNPNPVFGILYRRHNQRNLVTQPDTDRGKAPVRPSTLLRWELRFASLRNNERRAYLPAFSQLGIFFCQPVVFLDRVTSNKKVHRCNRERSFRRLSLPMKPGSVSCGLGCLQLNPKVAHRLANAKRTAPVCPHAPPPYQCAKNSAHYKA
jgi:hypothetical protein